MKLLKVYTLIAAIFLCYRCDPIPSDIYFSIDNRTCEEVTFVAKKKGERVYDYKIPVGKSDDAFMIKDAIFDTPISVYIEYFQVKNKSNDTLLNFNTAEKIDSGIEKISQVWYQITVPKSLIPSCP